MYSQLEFYIFDNIVCHSLDFTIFGNRMLLHLKNKKNIKIIQCGFLIYSPTFEFIFDYIVYHTLDGFYNIWKYTGAKFEEQKIITINFNLQSDN